MILQAKDPIVDLVWIKTVEDLLVQTRVGIADLLEDLADNHRKICWKVVLRGLQVDFVFFIFFSLVGQQAEAALHKVCEIGDWGRRILIHKAEQLEWGVGRELQLGDGQKQSQVVDFLTLEGTDEELDQLKLAQ